MLFLQNINPEDVDPSPWAIPTAVILIVLLLVITLVGLRRAKVKRDQKRRALKRAARRETYIQMANDADEEYTKSLPGTTPGYGEQKK